jgi:hypothetical protein
MKQNRMPREVPFRLDALPLGGAHGDRDGLSSPHRRELCATHSRHGVRVPARPVKELR